MRLKHLLIGGLILSLTLPLRVTAQDDLSAYRQSLDTYRTSEEQFFISAQQYYQLRTLASQDEAVKAARLVMLNRVDTLVLYLQMLNTALNTNSGIEMGRAKVVSEQISNLIDNLKQHRSRLEIATDRVMIEQEANFMDQMQSQITKAAYQALSLIKIGGMQAAIDHLEVTQSKLDDYISTLKVSETVRTEKQRGSQEITRSIADMKVVIADSLTNYDRMLSNSDSSSFHSLQQNLNKAYASLTQTLEFIKELAS